MNVVLDAMKMTTKEEAHEYLKDMLGLPDYYGKNLDALYDCLTELPASKVVIEYRNEAEGTYFDRVMEVFRDVPSIEVTIMQAFDSSEMTSGETAAGSEQKETVAESTGTNDPSTEIPSVSAPGENFERLVRCMERAANGEELTIGFIGGSITQGARASEDTKSYAYRCYDWWKSSFPQAAFHYVNGGIGGTCSYFGVARAEQDLLRYQPDVVFVDFSVNDVGDNGSIDQTVPETYEGLLRKILSWSSEPAVIALYNVFYDTGETVEPIHRQICEHYGIPGAGMRETVYKRLHAGEFEREYISPDGLHPNDAGHAMVAAELCRILERAKKLSQMSGKAFGRQSRGMSGGLHNIQSSFGWELPEPLTANRYEDAILWNISNVQPKLEGFRADPSEKSGHLDCFKNGWIGKKKGDKMTFIMECESLAVQYRKTIHKPSPIARLTIDGDAEHALILDGNFDQDWGDCLYLQRILRSAPLQEHTIEIEIIEATQADEAPFYLLSLITA